MNAPPLLPGEADYDDIEAAILDTEHGQWFLEEHVKRTRRAETRRLMAAIEGLERVTADLFWLNLTDLEKEISGVQAEIKVQSRCAQCALASDRLGAALQRLADQIKRVVSASRTDLFSEAQLPCEQPAASTEQFPAPEVKSAIEQIDRKVPDPGQSSVHQPPNAIAEDTMATERLIRKACDWLERLGGDSGNLST